jgi:ABC-type multidrug transport system ATPase subunit
MLEVQRMCNRIIFLNEGHVIASGTPIEVTRKVLKEDRAAPALDEVFVRIVRPRSDEAISN